MQILQAQSEEEKNEWIGHLNGLFENVTSLPSLKAVTHGVMASNRLAALSSVSSQSRGRSGFESRHSYSSTKSSYSDTDGSAGLGAGRINESRTVRRVGGRPPSTLQEPLISR